MVASSDQSILVTAGDGSISSHTVMIHISATENATYNKTYMPWCFGMASAFFFKAACKKINIEWRPRGPGDYCSAVYTAAEKAVKELKWKYCFVVAILAFGYSALQLMKGIYDIAHRGFFVTEKVSDYTTFILDQLVTYLLISSCSVSIPVIQHLDGNSALHVAAWTSSSMLFATFFVMASSALLSGYRLCKRVIW